MSQNLNERYVFLIFHLFKPDVLTWNFSNVKIGLSNDDKYQKVCKYLKALEEKEGYDIRKLLRDAKPLSI